MPSSPQEYSKVDRAPPRNYDWRDADLRVRVRGVRGALRGAGRRRRGECSLSECGSTRTRRLLLGRLTAGAPAARAAGPLRRIAPGRARSGPRTSRIAESRKKTVSAATPRAPRAAWSRSTGRSELHPLPPARDPHQGRLRRRQRRCRPDVRRRGPGRRRGPPGAAVRGPRRAAAEPAAGRDRARREDVFIANVLKSRPPGNRDPQPEEIAGLRALPLGAGAADRAEGGLHAGQFRDQAADRQPDRDHARARRRRRSTSSAAGPSSCCRSSIRPRRCARRR